MKKNKFLEEENPEHDFHYIWVGGWEDKKIANSFLSKLLKHLGTKSGSKTGSSDQDDIEHWTEVY